MPTCKPPSKKPARGRRRTNADKRVAVLSLLRELNENGENLSNYLIAEKCKVSESMVRVVKKEIGYKPTTQKTQSKDGREIDTQKIGSATKHIKKKKAGQRRRAKTKTEKLEGIKGEAGKDLDSLIHRCSVCKRYYAE